MGARHASAETKEIFNQVRVFLVEAAKELAERELSQIRQEVSFHKAAGENGQAKAFGKVAKDLEKSAGVSPARWKMRRYASS